jgi:hypothetical protein
MYTTQQRQKKSINLFAKLKKASSFARTRGKFAHFLVTLYKNHSQVAYKLIQLACKFLAVIYKQYLYGEFIQEK